MALEADGFVALLERSEFIKRISGQDREIVSIMRCAKNDATRSEARLALFERRRQTVTTSECTAARPCRPAAHDRC